MTELRTERLLLRQWRESDRGPWAAMNADSEVREHFPGLLTRAESDESVDRFAAGITERGWGLWALEVIETGEFIGFTGIHPWSSGPDAETEVEVGWRLARPAWGHGYATEAARAAMAHGFDVLGLDEIISVTAVGNTRSRAVMERLGMTRDPGDDFDHPLVPPDSPLRRHVLYRSSR